MVGRGILAGLSLLAVTAGLASASPAKQGGIFHVGMTGASTQIDPQLAYVSTAWWLEYATAAKLYNYPDKAGQPGALLRPEVASGFTVGDGGRTYSFTIRKGFHFSDGAPVTARNFAYAFQRAKDPTLSSPAEAFIEEVRSVRAKGGKLVIRLTNPDPALLTKVAMPFFQATSLTLPLHSEATGVYPSAGPYYFARNDVNVLTSIRRNPYWKGMRPRHLTGLDVVWNGAPAPDGMPYDLATVSSAEAPQLAARFGVNKSRFWAMPTSCIGYIAFNNRAGLFAGNPELRKAVNWALDRTDYFGGAAYSFRPWTHLLPPLTPGSITVKKRQPYAVHANLVKARKLAEGHLRDGKVSVAYRSSGTLSPAQAQVVRRDLTRLGFAPDDINMRPLAGAQIYEVMGAQANGFDMFVNLGMCSDYPDPAGFLSLFGVQNSTYERRLRAAAKLAERGRYKTLGELDLQVMRKLAPVAPMGVYNDLFFFSNRVAPRSLVYHPYTSWSIPALALK